MQNVKFYFGSSEKFKQLVDKNPLALYFLEDVQQLWKGDKLYATGSLATSIVNGLMSAEDKAKLDALVAKGDMELIPIDKSIVISDVEGGKAIGVAVSGNENNLISIEDDGLFVGVDSMPIDKIVGLEDELNKINEAIGVIPDTYATIDGVKDTVVPIKYEISSVPEGTLINYGEKEIRVMCPADAKFVKQNVGAGGNANMYYMTFTTYAPDGAVTFKEGDRGVVIDEILDFENTADTGIDKYGRKYKHHWFALASYDAANDVWTYFGKNSSVDKYIGWDFVVEWYSESGVLLAKDSIRINLSNEDCHDNSMPYYMNKYATVEQLNKVEESLTWSEIIEF